MTKPQSLVLSQLTTIVAKASNPTPVEPSRRFKPRRWRTMSAVTLGCECFENVISAGVGSCRRGEAKRGAALTTTIPVAIAEDSPWWTISCEEESSSKIRGFVRSGWVSYREIQRFGFAIIENDNSVNSGENFARINMFGQRGADCLQVI